MLKKILMLVVSFMFVASMAWAECPGCNPTVTAGVATEIIDNGLVHDPASNGYAGNTGAANVTLNVDAFATGRDSYKWKWSWWSWDYVLVPGEAEADGTAKLNLTSDVDIYTNGQQPDGLAFTGVKAKTILDIDGVVWAKGTDGCLQEASIGINGSISAEAYGNSFSGDEYGAFASAGGTGVTTVYFNGYEQDTSTYGGWFSSNTAKVDFDSRITVDQKLFTASYVSPDGSTSANFACVGGGSAESELGRDGWFGGRDNIQLNGITASGQVGQAGKAINGGSVAYGASNASFSGAYGSVQTIPGYWCSSSSGQTANVGGYAVVTGYNNVSVNGNSITVTSKQHAKATTGNTQGIQFQEVN